MRIGIHTRRPEPESLPLIGHVLDRLLGLGFQPVLDHHLAEALRERGEGRELPSYQRSQLPTGLDLLLSMGGDGTFLRAVRTAAPKGIPVLGINLGRLGFLADLTTGSIDLALERLKAGDHSIEERTLLEAQAADGSLPADLLALNDVSFHKRDRSSMLSVETYVDDRFLNTYWADGLIVATPTGSTAYSLSCGGPILDPRCRGLVITPIAHHNLNVRPFVVPDTSVIRVVVHARQDKYLVNLDARGTTLAEPVEVTIRRSAVPARIVHLPGHDFFDTLRRKLNWGMDVRGGGTPPAKG